ncbi:MAG: hypothetical protein Q9208_000089 [Pyrenodesmia sp. 3 TL-2023]
MSPEQEPSILEYARYYGLSRSHLDIDPLELLPPTEDISLPFDDGTLWEHFSAHARSPPHERLQAVKEASAFLAVTDPKQYEGCAFEDFDPLPRHRIHDNKQELPLLRTDHEVDMLNFAHRIVPNLADEFFPSEKVNDEEDEGFGWPSKYLALPEQVFQRAQNEKLVVGKDVLAYIGSVLDTGTRDGEPEFDYERPYNNQVRACLVHVVTKLSRVQDRLREPITPPLLPRSPTPQPYEPSSDTGRLEFLSDHSSPTGQQAEALDRIILEKDALTPTKRRINTTDQGLEAGELDSVDVGDIYSPLKGIGRTPSPPPHKRSRREDLKVEGPLTPPASDQPPPWSMKRVTFSEMLHEVIPHLPPPIPEPEQLSSEDIDMLFAEHIAPVAAKAEQAIEQEQLSEADTASRVAVPIMDFTKPVPPWYVAPSEAIDDWKKRILLEIKQSHTDLSPWMQDSQTKKGLSWVPFPTSLGRFELQEIIEDDGSLASFLDDHEPIDPETLTWKPPGLRIFDENDDSDEEELECGVFPPAGDVRSLIKERVLELQNNDERDEIMGYSDVRAGTTGYASQGLQANDQRPVPETKQGVTAVEDHSALDFTFSAMDSLDQFLGIRKGELRKSRRPMEKSTPTSIPRDPTVLKVAETSSLTLPCPKLVIPDQFRYFIASTSFLSNRRIAHRIENIYPSAKILERDFNLYSLHAGESEANTHLVRKSPEVPPDEADLILSPSTGLILTNLQKIKQLSLPGQAARSPVRERIQRTATRYECLVVMVNRTGGPSDSNADAGINLEESDCEALVSLTAFINHLPELSESELILVDGDTTILATWIISVMIRYSIETSATLLQEETVWEVFLRQAGMNAFAAQVVLEEMKTLQGSDGRPLGLRGFVLMNPEERHRRFEGVFGGRGLLDRVGEVLDARW